MGIELLFLLLPVAAFSGWLLGRGSAKRAQGKDCPPQMNSRYFQGLNYLLDERPDAALDVFIGISELDSESVEIQFALASLFLRRGEVERAIRIHQNLIARPTLSTPHRRQALYALGMDYMSAGLLDRAENLFRELLNDPVHGSDSHKQLLDIFQQEKEWEKAIDVAQRIRGVKAANMATVVAQYYCELAEQMLSKSDLGQAGKYLRSAVDWDKNCVRASLLEAELASRQGLYAQAIRSCKRVEQQDPDYLPLILEPLEQACLQLNQGSEYRAYLESLVQRHHSPALVEPLVRLWIKQGDTQRAESMVRQSLANQPSLQGLSCLLDVVSGQSGDQQWQQLRDVTTGLLQSKARFQCRQCGYQGRSMLWQCPGCKQWNSIKPV